MPTPGRLPSLAHRLEGPAQPPPPSSECLQQLTASYVLGLSLRQAAGSGQQQGVRAVEAAVAEAENQGSAEHVNSRLSLGQQRVPVI